MKLAEWRKKKGLSLMKLAELLNTNASSLYYYEHGRIPRPNMMIEIEKITKGKVKSKDFYN